MARVAAGRRRVLVVGSGWAGRPTALVGTRAGRQLAELMGVDDHRHVCQTLSLTSAADWSVTRGRQRALLELAQAQNIYVVAVGADVLRAVLPRGAASQPPFTWWARTTVDGAARVVAWAPRHTGVAGQTPEAARWWRGVAGGDLPGAAEVPAVATELWLAELGPGLTP